jgi:hypothetical protein
MVPHTNYAEDDGEAADDAARADEGDSLTFCYIPTRTCPKRNSYPSKRLMRTVACNKHLLVTQVCARFALCVFAYFCALYFAHTYALCVERFCACVLLRTKARLYSVLRVHRNMFVCVRASTRARIAIPASSWRDTPCVQAWAERAVRTIGIGQLDAPICDNGW